MTTRRDFLKLAGVLTVYPYGCVRQMPKDKEGVLVNDIHSKLNPTLVNRIARVESVDAIRKTIKRRGARGKNDFPRWWTARYGGTTIRRRFGSRRYDEAKQSIKF